MKKSRYSEEHIATALRQVEAGTPIPEVTRSRGVSEATSYCKLPVDRDRSKGEFSGTIIPLSQEVLMRQSKFTKRKLWRS